MSKNFAEAAKIEASEKLTENGALAYSTTSNDLLDLFAQVGALRPRSVNEIEQKFAAAFAVDPLLTTKLLFYCGNIRGGLGERRTFRIGLHWMAANHPQIIEKNLGLIPFFNRWDSIYELVGTPVENAMWRMVKGQLADDLENYKKNKPISLCAKWLKSENASSETTRKLAKLTAEKLNLRIKQYRKLLSKLRAYLNVTEVKMSANEWEKISYAAVPSYAMKNYSAAFMRHDMSRFKNYLDSVKNGEKKINASTLFPYDLVHQCWVGEENEVTELQWKALPDYVCSDTNILVMADVSGSMYGRPIETSIGLATYFAQRNTGAFHNLYMSFSSSPRYISIKDNWSLNKCVQHIRNTDIDYNTNLDAAFEYVLQTAKRNNILDIDLPRALVVISDMEIDPYFTNPGRLNFVNKWKRLFAAAGYTMPKLVLWNVEARNDTFLSNDPDVILVSGQSVSTFYNLCGALGGKSSWDFMLEVLNDKMYDSVKI